MSIPIPRKGESQKDFVQFAGKRYQMVSFKASNLRDGFDVRVMPGVELPADKGTKTQLVTQFRRKPKLGPEKNPR